MEHFWVPGSLLDITLMIPQEQSKTLSVVNTHTYTHTTFNIQQTWYFTYHQLRAQRAELDKSVGPAHHIWRFHKVQH